MDWCVVTNVMTPTYSSVIQMPVYPALVPCTQLPCGLTLQDSALDFVYAVFCMLPHWVNIFVMVLLTALSLAMHFIPLVHWTRFVVFCVNHSSIALLIIPYTLTEVLNKALQWSPSLTAIITGYIHRECSQELVFVFLLPLSCKWCLIWNDLILAVDLHERLIFSVK